MSAQEISITEVEKVLDAQIRPELALHGGNIHVEKLEKDVLYVRMLGQCRGCPSAELTMENLVNTTMTETFPQLKQVVLVTGVSDSLLEEAKAMMRQRHL